MPFTRVFFLIFFYILPHPISVDAIEHVGWYILLFDDWLTNCLNLGLKVSENENCEAQWQTLKMTFILYKNDCKMVSTAQNNFVDLYDSLFTKLLVQSRPQTALFDCKPFIYSVLLRLIQGQVVTYGQPTKYWSVSIPLWWSQFGHKPSVALWYTSFEELSRKILEMAYIFGKWYWELMSYPTLLNLQGKE